MCLNFKHNFSLPSSKKKKKKKAKRDYYRIISNYANVLKLCYSFALVILSAILKRPQSVVRTFFPPPQLNAQSVGGRRVLNSRLLCSYPQLGNACKFTEPCMCTQRTAAPFPLALTFINLINASGVFVAALNAVISSNTNKCGRSGSGQRLKLYSYEIHGFLSCNTEAVLTLRCPNMDTHSITHKHTHTPAVNKPT